MSIFKYHQDIYSFYEQGVGKESVLSDLATLVIFLNMRAHLAPPGVRLPFTIDLQALQKIIVLRCFFPLRHNDFIHKCAHCAFFQID